jgi:hypothetical protein
MAAQYNNITQVEMEEFLIPQGFKAVSLNDSTVELVYGKRIIQDDLQLTLRVYTGINPGGDSRAVGQDAIRVNLFMRTNDGRIFKIGGSKRVHRVKGWKNNLQSRLDGWIEYLPKHKCDCGLPMIPRKGSIGQFLGCVGFPTCKNTKSIDK